MGISLYSLGAAQEVTGSKHIFEIDGRAFMVDCGAFQGKRKEADAKNRNFQVPADRIEAVILTHAHLDHCGLLPLLVKKGFNGNIYSTPATRDLASLIMMDSARIQARDADYLRKQAQKKKERFTWQPLFGEKDVVRAADQFVALSYRRKMHIASDVRLEFFDAGHILGSAMAVVTIARKSGDALYKGGADNGEIRIAYTGDLGRKNKAIIRDPDTDIPAVDYLFLESTYGNRRHEDSDTAMDELEQVVRRAVALKGKVIIPAFAIERTQELVYYLHLLVDKKRIPEVPIYVDSPMATSATGIFQIHPECYDSQTFEAFLTHHKNPFGFNALSFIASVEESKALNKKKGPMIIISADGMCESGRIVHHVANNISQPENTILIVGYMAENTLGRRIADGQKEVRIMGDFYKVNAEVRRINAFSAHADYTECAQWLDSIDTSRLKKIFLVHGEKGVQESFASYLNGKGYKDVEIVKYGKTYNI